MNIFCSENIHYDMTENVNESKETQDVQATDFIFFSFHCSGLLTVEGLLN